MERRGQGNKGEESGGYEEIGVVDWRGRASNPEKHGGMRAASFVLGLYFSDGLRKSWCSL